VRSFELLNEPRAARARADTALTFRAAVRFTCNRKSPFSARKHGVGNQKKTRQRGCPRQRVSDLNSQGANASVRGGVWARGGESRESSALQPYSLRRARSVRYRSQSPRVPALRPLLRPDPRCGDQQHMIDQQLCHWILLSLGRLPSSELSMTQELIADMLGVRVPLPANNPSG
jgi:hypothetical protein